MNGKRNPQRTLQCFHAYRELHSRLQSRINCPDAQGLLAFFRSWRPEEAPTHPALREHWEGILSGGNLVFRWGGRYLQDGPFVRRAWDAHYLQATEGPEMVCLVTGERSRWKPSILPSKSPGHPVQRP